MRARRGTFESLAWHLDANGKSVNRTRGLAVLNAHPLLDEIAAKKSKGAELAVHRHPALVRERAAAKTTGSCRKSQGAYEISIKLKEA
jgi:hypothetical protein